MSAIEMIIEPRRRQVGNSAVRRLLPWRLRRMVGPFVFADLIGPADIAPGVAADIDPHPHIGLATVTYLFEGEMVHRDSTGAVQSITPGAVNWMTAGSGIVHSERGHPDDLHTLRKAYGMQTWVALPDDLEDTAPSFASHTAETIPEEVHGGVTVRVVAGNSFALTSPVEVSSPLVLAELQLADSASIALDNAHPERAVVNIDGDIRVAGTNLPAGHVAVIEPGTQPELSGSGRAMVLGGEPVGQRNIWWNFVHSNPERIEQAKLDWTAQRFPLIPDDHETWVPLPGPN